jgi:hypothetical protein
MVKIEVWVNYQLSATDLELAALAYSEFPY